MQMKNITENGKITYKTDTEFIFGLKNLEKENFLEIVMKDNGQMEKDKDMEYFIMLMDQNMKVNGKIILKKASPFSLKTMGILFKDISNKTVFINNQNTKKTLMILIV